VHAPQCSKQALHISGQNMIIEPQSVNVNKCFIAPNI